MGLSAEQTSRRFQIVGSGAFAEAVSIEHDRDADLQDAVINSAVIQIDSLLHNGKRDIRGDDHVVIGSVTDGYNPQEEQFGNTRKLLEQLIGSDADILICTKSDLVVRDIDLLKKLGRVTVSWSINTLDENFKNDMDSASSIERRIAAMKQVYDAGIRTVCFVSPVFPGITDFEAIFERVKDQCDLFWLENLNLRGGFKKTIMDYIAGKYPDLVPLYDEIYNKHNRSYFEALEVKAEEMAKKYDCPFADNEMPYGRVPQGHPVIVDYFYHEEIRGTENTGKRNR